MHKLTNEEALPLTGSIPFRMTNDLLFKALFQRNSQALKAVICAYLDLSPDSIFEISILNPIQLGSILEDKEMILDIKAILDTKLIINLEMQVLNFGSWPERSLSYLTRCFDNLKAGDAYEQLRTSIHLGFLDYTLFPEEPAFFAKYRMLNVKTGHEFSGKFELNVVDLTRRDLATRDDILTRKLLWADFFKATTWEELNMLAKKDDDIQNAVTTIKQLSGEEYFRLCCEAREDRIRYERSLLNNLNDTKQELESSKKELEINKKKLEVNRKELESRNRELYDNKKKLADNEKALEAQTRIVRNRNKTIQEQAEEIRRLKRLLANIHS